MHTRLVWSDDSRQRRSLTAKQAPAQAKPAHDSPLTGRDEAIFLLHLGAEVEQALMVQYLYAAYSLAPPSEPAEAREQVLAWQQAILNIAREEMGHLITVQNLLRLIGGPLHFQREAYPFRSDFYPFHFQLEPLSIHSLAKYVVAEMPLHSDAPEIGEILIEAMRGNQGRAVNRVGLLYGKIIELFSDQEAMPDSVFQSSSVPYQADFSTWGRNYTRTKRPAAKEGSGTPEMLIQTAANRTQAVAALKAISEQGEGLEQESDVELSHFERFLEVYRGFKKEHHGRVKPVAFNPVTAKGAAPDGEAKPSPITHPVALGWGQLFNTRYRLLLSFLAHALHIEGSFHGQGGPSARGRLIVGAFGEMYHLRAIANILMELPLTEEAATPRAGPPFELPYTLDLPDLPQNRWLGHRDVLESTQYLIDRLRAVGAAETEFLSTLEAENRKLMAYVEAILEPFTSHPAPVASPRL